MIPLTLTAGLALIPVLVVTIVVLQRRGVPRPGNWLFVILILGLFSAWSFAAVFAEGLLGFWPVHTQSLWGNQVWFDLLIALTVAFVMIVPRAEKLNMKLPLWLIFILCTGSIGLLALLGRLLYLERQAQAD